MTVIPLTGVLCYLLSKFQIFYIFLNIWIIAKLRFERNLVAYVYKLMKKKILIISIFEKINILLLLLISRLQ